MKHVELLAINDHQVNGMAVCLKPRIPFVITHSMVSDIRKLQNKIAEEYYLTPWDDVYYLFWYLHGGSIPWKGLDFDYLYNCLTSNNECELENYIDDLFSLLYINYVGLDLPLVSCSIVNRKLCGISQDFFYLNRVNFIKQDQSNRCNYEKPMDDSPISLLDFNDKIKNASFPNEIYMRNDFYTLHSVDLTTMREILDARDFSLLSSDEKNKIKLIFDERKNNTITRIYKLASQNINLIARFAAIQACEHTKYVSDPTYSEV